jgi:arsenate reductase
VADPAAVEGRDDQKRAAFREASAILRRRIEMLAGLPIDELDESAMKRELRRIGEK